MVRFKHHLAKYGDTYADWDPTSSRDAQQILASITSFEFIVAFVTIHQYWSHIAGTTAKIQKTAMDIVEAHDMITKVSRMYQLERKNIDSSFDQIYTQSVRMAEKFGTNMGMPHITSRQQHCSNISREMLQFPSLAMSSCASMSSSHHQPLVPLHCLALSQVSCAQKKQILRRQ